MDCLSKEIYLEAVSVLKKGGVVAYPTETYYGLAVDPGNEKSLEKLFQIKRRESMKPILVLIKDVSQLTQLSGGIPVAYKSLIEKYWPGPLTLIFPTIKKMPSLLTGGSGGLGIRISSHPIAQAFCKAWGQPLPATSANISGKPPAESASDVKNIFGDDVDFIIDGGTTPAGECSTIVGLQGDKLMLLRKGQVDVSAPFNQRPF